MLYDIDVFLMTPYWSACKISGCV